MAKLFNSVAAYVRLVHAYSLSHGRWLFDTQIDSYVAASLWYVSINSIDNYRSVWIGIILVVFVPWGSGKLGWNESVSQRQSGCPYMGVASDPVLLLLLFLHNLNVKVSNFIRFGIFYPSI